MSFAFFFLPGGDGVYFLVDVFHSLVNFVVFRLRLLFTLCTLSSVRKEKEKNPRYNSMVQKDSVVSATFTIQQWTSRVLARQLLPFRQVQLAMQRVFDFELTLWTAQAQDAYNCF